MSEDGPVTTTSAGSRSAEPEAGTDPRRWRALAVCMVAGFMSLLDVSIVNVAIPSIREGLDASASALQWIVSGYALSFGLLLVPAGRLGDARGRRLVFVAGLGLFTVASALCGLALSATWLVVTRLLQGFAGGVFQPQIAALIQREFRGPERRTAFGIFGATVGLSTAVGPVLGGLIIQALGTDLGWRGIFMVNVPIGIVAIPLALRLLPRDRVTGQRESLDPVGVVLLATGVLLLLLPLVEGRQYGWPWWTWVLLGLAVPVVAGFGLWERRQRRRGLAPVVDITLFRVRSYAAGTALATTYFAGFTGVFFVLTLYLQLGHGYSALLAGLSTIPFALSSAVTAGLSSRVSGRIGARILPLGLVLVLAGFLGVEIAVRLADGPHVGWALVAPLIVAGSGSGLVIAPNQALTLAEVPPAASGSAAGVLQTGQRVGSAIGIAAVGTAFFAALAPTQPEGGFATAIEHALWICAGVVAVALVLSVVDGRAGLRPRRAEATTTH
jgi:EmrB/QacA subfamily drug resistance transporter